MSYQSTLPGAVTALVARLQSWPPLAGVIIKDGGVLTDSDATEVLSVGYQGDTGEYFAEGQVRQEGAGGVPDREQFDIRCAVAVMDGTGDLASVRARAFALLGCVGDVLAADPRLGGAVMNASLSSWQLRLDAAQGGAYATIRFDVSADAYTLR